MTENTTDGKFKDVEAFFSNNKVTYLTDGPFRDVFEEYMQTSSGTEKSVLAAAFMQGTNNR